MTRSCTSLQDPGSPQTESKPGESTHIPEVDPVYQARDDSAALHGDRAVASVTRKPVAVSSRPQPH